MHKTIIQGYLKKADRSPVFFKKIGGLINSLREKNSHENYNVKKYRGPYKKIAQLIVKPVEPHRDQMLRLWDISIYFRLLVVYKSM